MKRARGVSLIELAVTVAVIGIIAIVVVPQYSASNPSQLELATTRITDILRYTRSEAMRTGGLRGVAIDTGNGLGTVKDVAAFVPDIAQSPFGIDRFLVHPLSKQDYDLTLSPSGGNTSIQFADVTAPFVFDGIAGEKAYIFFDANGAPVWLEDGATHRLTNGALTLALDSFRVTVVVQPVTGLVTVQ